MSTPAPFAIEDEQLDDEAHFYTDICEPFSLKIRSLAEDNVKLTWWYIAAVNEDEPSQDRFQLDKDKFAVEFHCFADALKKLTFQMDRDMVKKAIDIVTNTFSI
ncbi:MAG: hypothetical protein LQ339_000845 [Xanthoria mediterranea]|nr:MAG: hypothetical protein LQ339_000845 [Xanthoria mediterranea]